MLLNIPNIYGKLKMTVISNITKRKLGEVEWLGIKLIYYDILMNNIKNNDINYINIKPL